MYGLLPFERNSLFDGLGAFADDFFGEKTALCRTDIRDEGEKFVMEAELPGFEKEDISLDISRDRLTLTAKRCKESDEKDKNGRYIRRERACGTYSRSFDISGIDADNITAEYKNGVLLLDLPKQAKKAPETRRLEIR